MNTITIVMCVVCSLRPLNFSLREIGYLEMALWNTVIGVEPMRFLSSHVLLKHETFGIMYSLTFSMNSSKQVEKDN